MQQKGEFIASGQPIAAPVQQAAPVAEAPKKTKSGKVAKILCVIFALATAGLGGYICYDKFVVHDMVSSDSPRSEETMAQNVDEQETADIAEVEERPELTGFVDYVGANSWAAYYVTSKGEVYFVPMHIDMGGAPEVEWRISNPGDIGEAGAFVLNLRELGDFSPYMYEGSTLEIEGYKLNLDNITYVEEAGFGQNKSELTSVFVDVDGNMSILTTKGAFTGSAIARLEKNVLKNVACIKVVDGGEQAYTLVIFRDGSQKHLSEKLLGADYDMSE